MSVSILPKLGKRSREFASKDPAWSIWLRVDLRAVMFPLVSFQALMVEWIGLDMPGDLTSL